MDKKHRERRECPNDPIMTLFGQGGLLAFQAAVVEGHHLLLTYLKLAPQHPPTHQQDNQHPQHPPKINAF